MRIHDTMQDSHGPAGLYVASNVANSTRVWNLQVREPENIVGALGDIEHLRTALGPGHTLPANCLVWLTDRTPHESMPLRAGTHRQFFRLVTSNVSVWYAAHSTPNPLGVKPPESVRIIEQDKFQKPPPAASRRQRRSK